MSDQDQWEYRVRIAIRGGFYLLGVGGPSKEPSPGEKALAEFAKQDWELMPMTAPLAENAFAFVFRRRKAK